MNIKDNKFIIFALFILGIMTLIKFSIKTNPYYQVKKGNKELWCLIKGKGFIKIQNEKIISYLNDKNTWVFTNGYARNCRIKDKYFKKGEKMIIDKNMDKAMKDLCPKNYPKEELNYVYAKKNNVIVMDSKRLLIIKYNKYFVSKTTFINIRNNKKLQSNTLVFGYPAYVGDLLQYPNYNLILKRIFDKKIDVNDTLTLAEIVINIGSITGESIYISYFDALKSMDKIKIENVKVRYNDPNTPFMIEGGYEEYGIKLIIMPIQL